MRYVDVHTHLTHAQFAADADEAARRAGEARVERVVVNGLNPASNRDVLALCARHEHLLPALGLYPVDACAGRIDRSQWEHDWPAPEPLDVDAAIDQIGAAVEAGRQGSQVVALGEVGLDFYWVSTPAAVEEQERVFRRLCRLALDLDLPLICHTRKAEARALEILVEEGVRRADFHCFGGRLKVAKRVAEAGYYLSIPPVVVRAQSFQRMAAVLPLDRLLTETDAPYMSPTRGTRNEPANVPLGVRAMASARGVSQETMAQAIWDNYRRLFEPA